MVSMKRDFWELYYRARDFLWRKILVPVLIFAYFSPVFFAGIYYNLLLPKGECIANIVGIYYFLSVFYIVLSTFTFSGIILGTILILANASEFSKKLSVEPQKRKVLKIIVVIFKLMLLFLALLVLFFLFLWSTTLFLLILRKILKLVAL